MKKIVNIIYIPWEKNIYAFLSENQIIYCKVNAKKGYISNAYFPTLPINGNGFYCMHLHLLFRGFVAMINPSTLYLALKQKAPTPSDFSYFLNCLHAAAHIFYYLFNSTVIQFCYLGVLIFYDFCSYKIFQIKIRLLSVDAQFRDAQF